MHSSEDFEWEIRRKLSAEAEQDLGRRFTSGSPGYLLLMTVFAFGSSCWQEHPAPFLAFASLAAGASLCHQFIAREIARRYEESPVFWRASLRRAAYLSALLWSAFAAWVGITHPTAAAMFLLALVTAVAAAGVNVALGADELATERCLLLILAPVIGLELLQGWLALAAGSMLLLGFLVAQARAQSVTYWERLAQRADLELRAEKAERALVRVVEMQSTLNLKDEPGATAAPEQESGRAAATDLVSLRA